MIEVLEILSHIIQNILYCYIYFFHYSLIDVPYDLLNNFELLE